MGLPNILAGWLAGSYDNRLPTFASEGLPNRRQQQQQQLVPPQHSYPFRWNSINHTGSGGGSCASYSFYFAHELARISVAATTTTAVSAKVLRPPPPQKLSRCVEINERAYFSKKKEREQFQRITIRAESQCSISRGLARCQNSREVISADTWPKLVLSNRRLYL